MAVQFQFSLAVCGILILITSKNADAEGLRVTAINGQSVDLPLESNSEFNPFSLNTTLRRRDTTYYLSDVSLGFNCRRRSGYSSPEAPFLEGGIPIETTDSFQVDGVLYGSTTKNRREWPIEDNRYNIEPRITSEALPFPERYWLTSEGDFYYITDETTLFFGQKNTLNFDIDFGIALKDPYVLNAKWIYNITICKYLNATRAHMSALQNYLGYPSKIPSEEPVRNITWVMNDVPMTQDSIETFAKSIAEQGFGGQIEIEQHWESCLGSLEFDKERFPNPKEMVQNLEDLGFGVVLRIRPVVDVACKDVFNEAVEGGFLVRNTRGLLNGMLEFVDFTSAIATKWWTGRVAKLVEDLGLQGLSVVGGEAQSLPQPPALAVDFNLSPNAYTREFNKAVASLSVPVQVTTVFHSQELPLWVRMPDIMSTWDGLSGLIPALLQLNIIGYPFVIPERVGGNGKPSEELLIRWTQATVFMPAMRFAILPWNCSINAEIMIRKYMELHSQYADKILEIMKLTTETGAPVNPPIWWVYPKDQTAHLINDEYLLADQLLVAPVLKEGARQRDIYLPPGTWRDVLRNETMDGPVWLRNYSVTLDELPYFELLEIAVPTLPPSPTEDSTLAAPGGPALAWATCILPAVLLVRGHL